MGWEGVFRNIFQKKFAESTLLRNENPGCVGVF